MKKSREMSDEEFFERERNVVRILRRRAAAMELPYRFRRVKDGKRAPGGIALYRLFIKYPEGERELPVDVTVLDLSALVDGGVHLTRH